MKPKCPECGSENVAKLVYGEPTEETFRQESEGKVILMGCIISPDSKNSMCKDCKHEFDYNWNHKKSA